MGKSSNSRVPLSKTAKLVTKCSVLPGVLARMCGQFLGTDMPFSPGDTFVRRVPFKCEVACDCRRVRLVRQPSYVRYYYGKQFDVYTVVRVTPCTVKARKQSEFHVYEDWMNEGWVNRGNFIIDVDGPLVTLHARDGDAMNRQEFDKLDLSTATKVRIIPQIQHDAELNKLVVVDHSWST